MNAFKQAIENIAECKFFEIERANMIKLKKHCLNLIDSARVAYLTERNKKNCSVNVERTKAVLDLKVKEYESLSRYFDYYENGGA